MNNSAIIESACIWAVNIAADDSHGYSQAAGVRWGKPDYDCSSLVISAYIQADKENQLTPIKNATYTGNMLRYFKEAGFTAYKYYAGFNFKRGDILLNEVHHTALVLGNGTAPQIVHASISETGGITGKAGDQTGKEICTRTFYNYSKGWNFVLRLENETDKNKKTEVFCNVQMRELMQGKKGEDVKTLQTMLNYRLNLTGKNKLEIDGDFGALTFAALDKFHRKHNLTPYDGICGAKTWAKLLNG